MAIQNNTLGILGYDSSYFEKIYELELVPLAKAMTGDDIRLVKRIDTRWILRYEAQQYYEQLKRTDNDKILETFSPLLGSDPYLLNAVQYGTTVTTSSVIKTIHTEYISRMEKVYFQAYNNATSHKDKLRTLELIKRLHFDQQEDVYIPDVNNPSPPTQFLFKVDGTPCVAKADVTAIKGKAKGGKSTFLKAIVACAISNDGDVCGIKRNDTYMDGTVAPSGPLRILYFDTEQSRGTLDQLLKDCLLFAKLPKENTPLLKIVGTRTLTKEGRKERFDDEIANGQYDVVIIDGVKDIVNDINDPKETDIIVAELLQVAEQYNVALFVVLHENPGKDTDKMRGWLGTEVTNKAFLVWQVSRSQKTKGQYNVVATECRWKEPDPIAYRWNDDGEIEAATPDIPNGNEGAGPGPQSETREDKDLKKWMQYAKAWEPDYTMSMTQEEIVRAHMKLGTMSETTAKRRTSTYVEQNLLKKDSEGRYTISAKGKDKIYKLLQPAEEVPPVVPINSPIWNPKENTNDECPF